MKRGRFARGLVVLSLCATLWLSMGCTAVTKYFANRYNDALQMADVGITLTSTPQLGLYWNSLDALTFGYASLDGTFVGWGGNQIGETPFHVRAWGFIYAYQEIGWGDYDVDDPKTMYITNGGLPGYFMFWVPGIPQKIPAYSPACVHFFPHLGYVGLCWGIRWYEVLDFIVGFTTIDLAGDDNARIGSWPWQSEPQWAGGAE